MSGEVTPGQTVGPFFHLGLPYRGGNELVPATHPDVLRLHGRVLDGAGDPVPDALLELWQADPAGRVSREPGSLRRDGWTFTGWGRAGTDAAGHYWFATVAPGAAEPGRAPFFALTVFARGVTDRLYTRAYPPADPAVLAADPLLASLPEDRRATLLATPDDSGSRAGLRFDVRLQGDGETVFLAFPRNREPWT
ncbi:MAG TPA: protocatechuate 3,4-dioxygenase subunit alpha [Dactylosporangium sp.]|jgi:protocatechuate 3,4-dioxygenase alpha subunit|nr:protocatechuate 3,4-dioxygenase subunit alpha [Dactylosporangium sp.]